MNTQDSHLSQNEPKPATPKKESIFLKFLWRHKMTTFLVLVIGVLLVWSYFKISGLENDFAIEKQELIADYEVRLDSLNSDRLLLTATTLSWAIRGELLRENNEQINQYFNEFVKNPDVLGLQLINPESSVIEISTDKKNEGSTNSAYNKIDAQFVKKDSANIKIVTPITGLNQKAGIFIMDLKNTATLKK